MIAFFYHFKAKIGLNGSKNEKHIPFHIYSKSNSASNFAFVKYEIVKNVLHILAFLITFKPKSYETAQKTRNIFYFTSISGLRGSFLSKKVIIVVP
jgi:hypothetical protein